MTPNWLSPVLEKCLHLVSLRVYSPCLASYWPPLQYILRVWHHAIGHTSSKFYLSGVLLATLVVHSPCQTSCYWPHFQCLLRFYRLIGSHTFSIYSVNNNNNNASFNVDHLCTLTYLLPQAQSLSLWQQICKSAKMIDIKRGIIMVIIIVGAERNGTQAYCVYYKDI